MTASGTSSARALAVIGAAALLAGCTAIAPAQTADSGVHGMAYGDFSWAGTGPSVAIGPIDPATVREDVDRAAAVIDDDRDADFSIDIVALFKSADEATGHAGELRTILHDAAAWYADPAHADDRAALDDPDQEPPMTPPEAAAMQKNLLAAGTRGIGWGGAPDDAGAAVRTLGPFLFVTGLKSDQWAKTDVPPIHPLAHLLAAQGADVRVEGGTMGEGAVVDASCAIADPAVGRRLRDDIGDAMVAAAAYDARPPWIGPPITDKERLARATLARWSGAVASALSDGDTMALAQRVARAATPDERAAALKDFQQRILSEGSRRVEGAVDPEVLALLLAAPQGSDDTAEASWRARLGIAMGALPTHDVDGVAVPAWDDAAKLAIFGSDRLNGDRLEISQLSFNQFPAGFSSLAAYLADQGCRDLRIGLVGNTP